MDEMARHFKNQFEQGNIQLYDHPLLLTELAQTSLVEKPSGRLKLSWPHGGGGHGDCACSFSLGLLAAGEAQNNVYYPGLIQEAFREADKRMEEGTDIISELEREGLVWPDPPSWPFSSF